MHDSNWNLDYSQLCAANLKQITYVLINLNVFTFSVDLFVSIWMERIFI